ncbi:MAG: PrpF family protein [Proteobacteria bacterium]|nr:PrpF family protein [Pseudomonadota bacterium]MDA1310347.1 PrpF family protein [Pseudomonadota bacterium]
MAQIRIPATFMRGGSSKGVFFHDADLPADRATRDQIFLRAIGSPDPYGRQLNGMGGGVSSVSKAVVIGKPSRPDADVDYTFAQVAVGTPVVDYAANCGNLSSAVGPFAIDTGLLAGKPATAADQQREVLIHNTNSGKIIRSTVPLEDGQARVEGSFEIPGVGGSGARIRLDFLDPGGTTTGALLPTGNTVDTVTVDGAGDFEMSMVDSSVPCVFLDAARFGLSGAETVAELEAQPDLMTLVEQVRRVAAVHMGLAKTPETAPGSAPKLGLVARPTRYSTLAGQSIAPDAADLAVRIWSMGQVHRVLPLTGALCLAVACRIPGTLCHDLLTGDGQGDVRLANPSGVLPLDAQVSVDQSGAKALQVTAYRTARTLMEGNILIPDIDPGY